MVGGVLLVSAKVFGLLSLGFILGEFIISPREISFSFRGFFLFLLFYFFFIDLKLTPLLIPFFYLPIEWQEVTKRFRPIRLGIGGVPSGKRLLQAV